jgi:glycosyltransferase involved in cell wall biosynthesis
MKIGIYSPYIPTAGGGERYMMTIAYILGKTNTVDIFWNNEIEVFTGLKKLGLTHTRCKVVPNIFIQKHGDLRTYFVTKSYDLIIYLSDGSIPNVFAKKTIIHFQQPFIRKNGLSFIEKFKLKKINAVICNSEFTKKYIDVTYVVNSKVLYPPVPVNEMKPLKKEKIILSVGRFHPVKKQMDVVRIFDKLQNKHPEWKLILAGGLLAQDKDYFITLKKSAGSNIYFKENIEYKELLDLYGKSMIYWHAAGYNENAEKNPEKMEHFGIAPVEAMAAGCVPVVFNGGGLPEIIQNDVNGFLWNTEEELINLTETVISSQSSADRIKQRAIETIKKFSQEEFEKQLTVILHEL